jgi:GrpB-like predicted nucleotidyltransferase (UPF0157 family)
MITAKQEEWLQKLALGNPVAIVPYDPQIKQAFAKIEAEVESFLGSNYPVFHCGASSLGISGQGDLDAYIPIAPPEFDCIVQKVTDHYGQPGSFYPLERARWNSVINGFKTELFVINKAHSAWTDSVLFENYLKNHPQELDRYRLIKEQADGQERRQYYRRKIEFINEILAKAQAAG